MKDKMPASLIEAMKQNKKIIFFINPPYATAANLTTESGVKNKKDCVSTMVQAQMKNFGKASANLYAQFFFRIMMFKEKYNLTNLHIGLFCPTLFLAGSGYKVFRKKFLNEFTFNKGFQFNAGYFANCASTWGIGFSIWNSGVSADKKNFTFDLVDFEGEEIEKIGEKVVYNIDNEKSAKDWAKEPINGEKLYNTIPLKSALNVGVTNGTKLTENYFGCYVNGGNNINHNTQSCFIINGSCNTVTAPSFSIDKLNFDRVVANFASRRLVSCNWINWADEYLAPNEEHPEYQKFINDSLIYSLFESKSNQSSLRQVDYKGKKWDIKNEFFFMSKGEIMELANEYHLDFTYNDAKVSSERFVYNKLQGLELSAEAKAVLDKAIELTKKSFKVRELFNDEHPEYQILNWDCGWYQIKGILKEFFPEDLKEFGELFKALADKMRPMVYELGFLK